MRRLKRKKIKVQGHKRRTTRGIRGKINSTAARLLKARIAKPETAL
jgi:hypothetical protein